VLYPALEQLPARVGILEKAESVKTGHQVFCRDAASPSWHQAVDLDLVANPKPSSYGDVSRDVADATTFSRDDDHGTHVSAIIGGRRTECWSGLLPRARLVLVDITDIGKVLRSIDAAVNADVRVFNVSQEFKLNLENRGERDRDPVQVMFERFRQRALFVASAGNDGLDLNREDAPAPARWSGWDNVVSVTGCDWNGGLLPALNHGKRVVDLVAPGLDVVSASGSPGRYGSATGSSQAAPQVAAAAALLVDPEGEAGLTPGDAKARLIATAEWHKTYHDKVWGGRLDFGAAVLFPDRTLVVTTTGGQLGHLNAVVLDGDPSLEITNSPTYYERRGLGELAPDRIRLSRILSLRRLEDGSFRVVLRDPRTDHLKIILGARFRDTDRLPCRHGELFVRGTGAFEPSQVCDQLRVEHLDRYVRGGSYRIQWSDAP
jgi:subtilisin family serine protease